MTVKELREQLSHYPDDIKVMWSYAEEVNLVVESANLNCVILSSEKDK